MLTSQETLSGVIRATLTINPIFEISGITEIAPPETVAPEYEYEYNVTPMLGEDLILPTANRTLKDDITINKINYHETSNESGGCTLYIGDD